MSQVHGQRDLLKSLYFLSIITKPVELNMKVFNIRCSELFELLLNYRLCTGIVSKAKNMAMENPLPLVLLCTIT